MPEIVEAVYDKEGLVSGNNIVVDEAISDKASGIYFSFYAIG